MTHHNTFKEESGIITTDIPFELELLRQAVNYQQWVADTVRPFLGNSILEMGAGIGNMSRWLPVRDRLILSEADQRLTSLLTNTVAKVFQHDSRVKVETIDLSTRWIEKLETANFDTVVSFNVLEHIENDTQVIQDLVKMLHNSQQPGTKKIVTFVPAHQWAYGTMDQEFGHYRRYQCADFARIITKVAPHAQLYCRYFNLIGLPNWFLLGRILKRRSFNVEAVATFEKICPWLRPVDDFLHIRLRLPVGQSLLSVITL